MHVNFQATLPATIYIPPKDPKLFYMSYDRFYNNKTILFKKLFYTLNVKYMVNTRVESGAKIFNLSCVKIYYALN